MPVDEEPLLQVENLDKTFVTKRRGGDHRTVAADRVSLAVKAGEALGVVGESGSGKTTLVNMIMGLERPDAGDIRFRGRSLTARGGSFPYGEIQIVFQDPRSSLDPRMTVRSLLREPLTNLPKARRRELGTEEKLRELARRVGLLPGHLDRRSHEFSGGQRQRIAIARALVTRPALVVLDEPTSALDVSIQAQILNLLHDLQRDYQLTYVFVSHNLAVVRHLCNEVAVLAAGQVVEAGATSEVFSAPKDDYTRTLLAAAPSLG
ncbi:MAG TPA: ATP-binding cassette domain-containing protein [Nocardioidaceae bacterium]|jgi:peptide/nickel transport system ATP-binding protein/oligopeptide transport system ATP-binding protein|nr:ATP-binding cassette domain-containing protein [Nocardioidaceae bacterium]